MLSTIKSINVNEEVGQLIVDIVAGFIKQCKKKLSISTIGPEVTMSLSLCFLSIIW